MDLSSSVNTIFAVTGPSAGVLQVCTARSALSPFASRLDTNVLPIVSSAFEAVAVPAAQYWRAASRLTAPTHLSTTRGTLLEENEKKRKGEEEEEEEEGEVSLLARRPDPRDINRSFYASRVDAMAHRRYEAHCGIRIVAADVRSHSTAKQFTTLRLETLHEFVAAVPNPARRNLYIVLDEDTPVDPFFDLDCSLPFNEMNESLDWETGLANMLEFLRARVESVTGATLERCVVLTSSVFVKGSGVETEEEESCEALELEQSEEGKEGRKRQRRERLLSPSDSKVSFHVHFRLSQRTAFANIRSLHHFMSTLREELDTISEPSSLHRLLRHCIDFGVYSRFRAFRLPYCVKAPTTNAIDTVALEWIAPDALHRIRVGAAALSVVQALDISALHTLGASAQQRQQESRVLTRMFFVYRFLLPLVPGVTEIHSVELLSFLSRYPIYKPKEYSACQSAANDDHVEEEEEEEEEEEKRKEKEKTLVDTGKHNDTEEKEMTEVTRARAVFELATVQRDRYIATHDSNVSDRINLVDRLVTITPPPPFTPQPQSSRGEKLLGNSREEDTHANPFSVPRPPIRDGVRAPVRDITVRNWIAEVFRCLSAAYDGGDGFPPISAERLNVRYQDTIRSYYAMQKQSRFCLCVNRTHRDTYPQLYLTYGSIKLRCYSNDCCGSCLAIPWVAEESEAHTTRDMRRRELTVLPVGSDGYPKYARLAEIRKLLFPPLPLDELMRRYGSSVLPQT